MEEKTSLQWACKPDTEVTYPKLSSFLSFSHLCFIVFSFFKTLPASCALEWRWTISGTTSWAMLAQENMPEQLTRERKGRRTAPEGSGSRFHPHPPKVPSRVLWVLKGVQPTMHRRYFEEYMVFSPLPLHIRYLWQVRRVKHPGEGGIHFLLVRLPFLFFFLLRTHAVASVPALPGETSQLVPITSVVRRF